MLAEHPRIIIVEPIPYLSERQRFSSTRFSYVLRQYTLIFNLKLKLILARK